MQCLCLNTEHFTGLQDNAAISKYTAQRGLDYDTTFMLMLWRNTSIHQEAVYRTKKQDSYSHTRQYVDYGHRAHYSLYSVFCNQYMIYIQQPVFWLFFSPEIKQEKQSYIQVLYSLLLADLSHKTGSWDVTTIMQK